MNSCDLDIHWLPFISRCGYCDIPYLVIAKAESFQTDQKFIGLLAGIEFGDVQFNPSSGGSTKSLSRKYFSQLDKETIDELYSLFKVDFEMFGYRPDEFYEYARSATNEEEQMQLSRGNS